MNLLCDRALLAGYVARAPEVSAKLVDTAAREILRLPSLRLSPLARLMRLSALAAGVTAVAALVAFAWLGLAQPPLWASLEAALEGRADAPIAVAEESG